MPETVFAPLATLGERLAGTRVLVLASSQRHVAAVRAALADSQLTVFDGARVHVPIETVEAATAVLAECTPAALVAIGGGSPIGLGKALRLSHEMPLIAVPTTYAGSEMTAMYGITRARDKQTGRDERVRPALVLYDVELTRDMPLPISVQSLCNALAHVVSVLSTDSLAQRGDALFAANAVVSAIDALLAAPADRTARDRALRAASRCATVYDLGKPGVQHGLAHLLGGAFNLDHAALHSILLPHFITHLARIQPALVAELTSAIGESRTVHDRPTIPNLEVAALAAMASAEPPERPTMRDLAIARSGEPDRAAPPEAARRLIEPPLAIRIRALLGAAGAPITLTALGVNAAELERVLATRLDLPARIALDALT
ncbi:MAG: iron-containing alcohol dehydrogenase [Deltaproteobacteria bacterium]|nr:iron-containing alcohol dehydrogenase [Deltaproteobacteria bacterium]